MNRNDELAILVGTAIALSAAERLAAQVRQDRDRQVIKLARDGVPYSVIAGHAGISDRAVSKMARTAGIRRYPAR